MPSLTGLYLSQITGGYRPRLRGYGVPSGLQGCNPTNAFCFSFAASWVPRNLGRPPSAVGQSSVTSCCRPYRKELDIEQRPAKNAIRCFGGVAPSHASIGKECRHFVQVSITGPSPVGVQTGDLGGYSGLAGCSGIALRGVARESSRGSSLRHNYPSEKKHQREALDARPRSGIHH